MVISGQGGGINQEGRQRVIIEAVTPEIDGGRFPIKRTVGDSVTVNATIFADGHDRIAGALKYRGPGKNSDWHEVPLRNVGEGLDRWTASFPVHELGIYVYTLEAWVDHFETWRGDMAKKTAARQDVTMDLLAGAAMIEAAASRTSGADAAELEETARSLRTDSAVPASAKVALAASARLAELMARHAERPFVTSYAQELRVVVDPVLARFSAWYELFPRSTSPDPGRPGTFRDVQAQLARIAGMGFDVLYLPPIHPIGRKFRKGPNGTLTPAPEDPGSPWAIGGPEGGHKSIHPELGTLDEFRELVQAAARQQIHIALDIAFQCSPDHPYVHKHPEWFKKRPDGTIQYAENPPKKYQDIYPFDFECAAWCELWAELKSIFEFWTAQGVKVFRVDNPHTKSLRFWEWCITELKAAHPELIFLAEAFTRRPVMYYLAKVGFTQSYNYFPWRNSKRELTEYLTEITSPPLCEYFRPNLWPNTPDILTEYLQHGGKPAFVIRLVLAATLGTSYGIYGPVFDLALNEPREPGSEEYRDSEKYEVKHWGNLKGAEVLTRLITSVNRIRRENPALQLGNQPHFLAVDNEQLLAFSRETAEGDNIVLTVVNLDPRHVQRGWIELPLDRWRLRAGEAYQVRELITGEHYLWSGSRNYVELNPRFVPAHIFRLQRYVRTENDFDYFL